MRLTFFNDAQSPIHIHPATRIHGVQTDVDDIQPQTTAEFEVPDGSEPWLKLWTDCGLTLLVSCDPKQPDTTVYDSLKPLFDLGDKWAKEHGVNEELLKKLDRHNRRD